MAEEKKKFKDWFDRAAGLAWVVQIRKVYPEFDGERFARLASRGLKKLEFKGRVQQFSEALAQTLPKSTREALNILRKSLPEPLPDCDSPTDGWLQWPMGEFIAENGLDEYEASLDAMVALTQRFSSEFAVRPFLVKYPDRMLSDLLKLVDHPSPHVRRWCSEGCRPRLPWGMVLKDLVKDPSPVIPILEALKDDSNLYVRRSVANNLNDIAKDHPDLVVELCKKWSRASTPDRDWLIKHALRSLVKSAHPGALAVLGFSPPKKLELDFSLSPPTIALGESVVLTLRLRNCSKLSQRLQVDYVVHYVRKKQKTSEKVFKWKSLELGPGVTVTLDKKHAMKSTTIRALYPGSHRIEVQINGLRMAEAGFEFRIP